MKGLEFVMEAEMELLRRLDNGEYVRMNEKDIIDVCLGGYAFEVGGARVPFDWEAHESGWNPDGTFGLNTGTGWMFKNYQLDHCNDEAYAEVGLSREQITAEFLAGAEHIDDFYINFVDKNGKECEVGDWKANGDPSAPFRLKLNRVLFQDIATEKAYLVDQRVLDAFNRGERVLGLDATIRGAQERCAKDVSSDVRLGEIVLSNPDLTV